MASDIAIKSGKLPSKPCAKDIINPAYEVRVSDTKEAREWDEFLAKMPGGHHVQTSMWARVKSKVKWQCVRIIVYQGNCIVAGAQMLMRQLPVGGAVGYVPKGPMCEYNDPVLLELVIAELHRVAQAGRVRFLILQPPDNGEEFKTSLQENGFRPSPFKAFPVATVQLDLSQNLDKILASMKSKTRYNIRLGLRKGMVAREGSNGDIATFHRILTSTGHRQDFSVNDEAYYLEIAKVFGRYDNFKLFVAEYNGVIISAMFVIAFGDTVLFKRGGWSGQNGALRPNEVMHWKAIQWAKSVGYRYYNFEGIDLDAAHLYLAGKPLDSGKLKSVTRFKLGFGGEVRLLPGVYDYVYNSAARWTYRKVWPRLQSSGLLDRSLNYVRSRKSTKS